MEWKIEPIWAHRIFDVLVRHCGASAMDRETFVQRQGEGASEFRFMGNLGYGGKFWNNYCGAGLRWRVDCYPEDETPRRRRMIARTNARLRLLQQERREKTIPLEKQQMIARVHSQAQAGESIAPKQALLLVRMVERLLEPRGTSPRIRKEHSLSRAPTSCGDQPRPKFVR